MALAAKRTDKRDFVLECLERRARVVLVGHDGTQQRILSPDRFTVEECHQWYERGCQVPVDLLPHEFWHDDKTGIYNCGEEALGEDF